MLTEAMERYDNQQGIQQLLIIFLCLIENIRSATISTPLYLYQWKQGRIQLLERLLEGNCLESCRNLSLDMYNFYHRSDVSHSWVYEMEPELEMERVRLDKREENLLADLLTRASRTVVLKLHTVATDDILCLLTEECKHLGHLDVSFARNVTDTGVNWICSEGSTIKITLQEMHIEGTNITSRGFWLLLENCKSLRNIESSLIEDFLCNVQKLLSNSNLDDVINSKDPSTCYKLSNLSLSIKRALGGSPKICQLIGVLFPYLENLQIHHIHSGESDSLGMLSNLKMLKSLMIGGVNMSSLSPCLENIGRNLTAFRFHCYINNSGKVELSTIINNCPSLVTLALSGSSVLMPERLLPVSPILPFLQNLQMHMHAFIPHSVWATLLSQCFLLQTVELTSCDSLTDSSLGHLLESNSSSLSNIISLTIRGGHRGDIALTEESVALLRERCPLLKQLGDCFTWSMEGSRQNSCHLVPVAEGLNNVSSRSLM